MNIQLVPITSSNQHILELMFLPENDDKFMLSSGDSRDKQLQYIARLLKFIPNGLGCAIEVDGETAGFIIAAGNTTRIVGGLLPKYIGQGIYKVCRNTVVRVLNLAGIYYVTNTVDRSNVTMAKFMAGVPHTMITDEVYLSHYNPQLPMVKYDKAICSRTPTGVSYEKLYHISFDGDLPSVLVPRLPYGSDKPSGKYPEPPIARVSFSPSPELCLRAVYPNISQFFDDKEHKYVEMYVYEAVGVTRREMTSPNMLIKAKMVHDANVTLEHWVSDNVAINLVGKVKFAVPSDDTWLMYQPFNTEPVKEHSPLSMVRT